MVLAYADGGGTVADFATWWPTTTADAEFDPALVLVAENTLGQVVGVCLCWSSAFVKDLVVHPEWRNRGIATALLHTAFRALANRGHDSVALKVRTNNPTAIDLYRQLGFEARR
jgi:ribosomal protein S18 acetylase RimI-like enzyme